MFNKDEVCYMSVYNSDYCADDQDFADSTRAGYQFATKLNSPVFTEVFMQGKAYVVIYDSSSSIPQDTDWVAFIQDDLGGEYEL